MALWLTAASVKAQAVVKIIQRHLIEKDEKIVIWATEPPVLMCLEILLRVLQIETVVIRAGKKNSERVQAELDFNTNPKVKCILLSVVSAQESMNLQKGGHIQINVDPISATSAIQIAGRTGRIGQLFEQIIYNLVVDESYDQYLQAVYMDRYRVMVAATTDIRDDVKKRVLDACTSTEQEELLREVKSLASTVTIEELALSRVRGAFADSVIRNLFGLRSSRGGEFWKDDDVKRKNLLPEETLFRIASGGALANEMMHQLQQVRESESNPREEPTEAATAGSDFPFQQRVRFAPDAPPITNAIAAEVTCIEAAKEITTALEYRAYGITPASKCLLRTQTELVACSSVWNSFVFPG